MKSKIFIIGLLILMMFSLVSASNGFEPSDDINMRNLYNYNNGVNGTFNDTLTAGFFMGDGSGITGVVASTWAGLTDINSSQFNKNGALLNLEISFLDTLYASLSSFNALDLRESNNNNTQASEIALKLDIIDQRYNESSEIASVNSSLQSEITLQANNNATQASQISLKLDSSEESNLNVNSSNFWDGLNSPLDILTLGTISVSNLEVVNAPTECSTGFFMTFTNMTNSICVVDQDTQYTNSSWDLSAIPTTGNVAILNFSLTQVDTVILSDGGTLSGNSTCTILLSPAGTGRVEACDI